MKAEREKKPSNGVVIGKTAPLRCGHVRKPISIMLSRFFQVVTRFYKNRLLVGNMLNESCFQPGKEQV